KGVPGLPVEFIAVPGDGSVLPETRLSDHSSFWDAGQRALMLTDTSFFRNPHYHRASDTPDVLDYPFLARVTEGVCQGVWRLLEAAEVGGGTASRLAEEEVDDPAAADVRPRPAAGAEDGGGGAPGPFEGIGQGRPAPR